LNNDLQTETKFITTGELQQIKAYCQAKNLNTLSFADLQQTQTPHGFNLKSPWVIATGVILVVGMIGLVVYFIKRKNKE
jgi:hypothetical protein